MTSDNTTTELINWYLDNAGIEVPKEQYQARLAVCHGCDFHGDVEIPKVPSLVEALANPLKLFEGETIILPGCQKCGCPDDTKPKFLKFFHPKKLKRVMVECPQGFWEPIDSQYQTS